MYYLWLGHLAVFVTRMIANDCLGICQYVTQHLDDSEATRYLLTIEGLAFDDWRTAKETLPGTCVTNKNTIEGNIKEIISVFRNTEVKDKYVVTNLGVLPGMQIPAIQLASYTLSTFKAVKDNIIAGEKQLSAVHVSDRDCVAAAQSTLSTNTSAGGNSPKSKPTFADKAREDVGGSKRQDKQRRKPTAWTVGENTS